MSFGGAVSAMVTSLKNNKRPRVSAFKRLKGYENVKYKKGKIEKKATPQQLKEIRERIQKENKKERIFTIVFMTTAVIILYILFTFVKF